MRPNIYSVFIEIVYIIFISGSILARMASMPVTNPIPPLTAPKSSTFRRRISTQSRGEQHNVISETTRNGERDGTEPIKRLRGQAAINAVLNQHITHLHADHAVCPLSEAFRAKRKDRYIPVLCAYQSQLI